MPRKGTGSISRRRESVINQPLTAELRLFGPLSSRKMHEHAHHFRVFCGECENRGLVAPQKLVRTSGAPSSTPTARHGGDDEDHLRVFFAQGQYRLRRDASRTQELSGRLEVTQRETSKKADRRRTRFNIPSVRNPVAESITCGRLELDLDGSIRAANRGLEQPRRTSRDHLVGANTVGRISRSRDRRAINYGLSVPRIRPQLSGAARVRKECCA